MEYREEVPVSMLTLTDKALKRVKKLMVEDPTAQGKSLRVALVPGGCSGHEYAISFDVKNQEDKELSFDGLRVLVDPKSADFLKDTEMDCYETPTGSGFSFKNPNVKGSCGCGKSYQF